MDSRLESRLECERLQEANEGTIVRIEKTFLSMAARSLTLRSGQSISTLPQLQWNRLSSPSTCKYLSNIVTVKATPWRWNDQTLVVYFTLRKNSASISVWNHQCNGIVSFSSKNVTTLSVLVQKRNF